MPSHLIQPFNKQITVTAAAVTATATAFQVPVADEYQILVNVTAATGTSPTCDIVLQHSLDAGTTYVNAPIRFAQMTAAGVHYTEFRCGLGGGGEAAFNQAGVADTGGALAKNFIFDPRYMKFKYTIGGTNPSFTFTFNFYSKSRSM